ncbi:YDL177C [Saccharomyces arboricola H-6]|uniref:YDL177C n=1 Tax=Saccharomyces arboricola (strain H-6 / AS 2.3317 / CBS 10644) TaxID=1160507 RepID=J8Q421_SACAR|nr:YDL177C [Saccharomyces arboricola H-6]
MSKNVGRLVKIWNESEVLIDRKSKFQARCCTLQNQKDIPSILQELIQNNKSVSKASHMHMYAWRTAEMANDLVPQHDQKKKSSKNNKNNNTDKSKKVTIQPKNIEQGCADCGESAAGQRLLTLLERANIFNVLVIVTRWYGGTPLGSSRFRHISTCAVESLKKGEFLP